MSLPAAVRDRAAHAAFLVVACALLLARLRLLESPPTARTWALVMLYGGLLGAVLLVPARRGARRIPAAAALLVGLLGVAAAGFAGGPSAPVPFASSAIALTILGAIAEEAVFRRAAYGALADRGPLVAIGITSLVFAAIHIPLYGPAAFPVDLGAGLLFGWQRYATGWWTVPASTHVAANLWVVLR